MVQTIIFMVLLICLVVTVIVGVVRAIFFLVNKIKKLPTEKNKARIKQSVVFLLGGIVLLCGFVLLSQLLSRTPDIVNDEQNPSVISLSELRKVNLNGRKEWISIRSKDINNPVLLFLAGGPGGSQMAAVRYDLSALENEFTVVNWDQPGSGKSYYALAQGDLTVDTYIEDGLALTEYLRSEFKQEKIYVVGESWGSALGIFLVKRAPELYCAFIGTGQMVDFLETEKIDYEKALEIATAKNDSAIISKLKESGPPPYYGKDVTWKSATYLNYLSSYMSNNPEIQNGGYQTFRDIFASEYGMLDKINYLRGVVNTFNQVYPQLYEYDLREYASQLEVPVYFFLGKHDVNAPLSITENYYEILQAPKKEIIWFEHSGHSPWINESDKFIEEVIKVKMADKYGLN